MMCGVRASTIPSVTTVKKLTFFTIAVYLFVICLIKQRIFVQVIIVVIFLKKSSIIGETDMELIIGIEIVLFVFSSLLLKGD